MKPVGGRGWRVARIAAVAAVAGCLALAAARPARGQSFGTLAGRVRDAVTEQPLYEVQILLDGGWRSAVTDTAGEFRLRGVSPGWHRVGARRLGYRPSLRDSVLVRAGETALLEIELRPSPERVDTLRAIDIVTTPDIVLDPLVTATVQRVTGEELRELPVSTLNEAVALSAGAVGQSYRGGRLGEETFVLDGLQVKNQLDASTGGLGLRFPPDMLTEAALVTNGFSARYGQVLSGLINVVTRDGGERWTGRLAWETDRPLPDRSDFGLDRFVASGSGPVAGSVRLVVVADLTGRLDADPVSAPAPSDPADPRSERANLLPHNSGETYDFAAKLTVPLGGGHIIRVLGLGSGEQRLLYDPAYKYDERFAPARRVAGNLVTAHWQFTPPARAARSLVGDFRVAYFRREFVRGPLEHEPDYRFGAFTFRRLGIVGENVARAQDTAAAAAPLAGFARPDFSETTPWGVPAFFLGSGPHGDLAWNRFGELRTQLDLDFGGRDADLFVGGEISRQHVQTFQRVLSYLPVGDSVPPAAVADFTPLTTALYAEAQVRWSDLAFTAGLRWDRFDPRTTAGGRQTRARSGVSPRFAVSTVLRGATFVASYGRFNQAPDFQYLVDAAFDDSLRTGRFRAGNPDLGYETATQYEFSVRARPAPNIALRINAFRKRLDGLVASVPFGLDPDSAIFGNADFGTVSGVELLFERERAHGWGMRVLYSLQKAEATATDAFRLFRIAHIAPTGVDTVIPAEVEFPLDYDRRHGLTVVAYGRVPDRWGPAVGGVRLLGAFEGSAIARWNSGLPYSRTNAGGDSLLGLPNGNRLSAQLTVDALVRRPVRLAGARGSLYVDARNLLGRRNVVAVRRDTGLPGLSEAAIAARADTAYLAHPEPIPYESPRYRPAADLDHNGLIEGAELQPLFLAAARDFFQPLFAYGPPRLMRIGLEVTF